MIKFTIPLKPVTKKNSQQILINRKTGKPFISPSKKYKSYELQALQYLPKIKTIEHPVNIQCLFYLESLRKCDLTNLLEAIDDVMVSGRLIADDNYTVIVGHDGSRVMYDPAHPRTEVIIKTVEELDREQKMLLNFETLEPLEVEHDKNSTILGKKIGELESGAIEIELTEEGTKALRELMKQDNNKL